MCPTDPAPVNQGVAIVAGHDSSVSAPTAPTTPAVRFSGPALRPDGSVARFSDPASRSRSVHVQVSLRSRTSRSYYLYVRTRTLVGCARSEHPRAYLVFRPPAYFTLFPPHTTSGYVQRVSGHAGKLLLLS
jgi:hypothetical protein